MRGVVVLGMVVLVGAPAWASAPAGTEASRGALERCRASDGLSAVARPAVLETSLALADAALAADEADALAHFAAFCALGRLLREQGLRLGTFARLRRLRREIDRTLELAPDFSDALAGKGALLLKLPRLLGGDPDEGERLLRRALELDPGYFTPRLALVDALRARGADAEARRQAEHALAVAEARHDRDDVEAARARLRELGGADP